MSESVTLFDSEADWHTAIELTLALAGRDLRIFDRDLVRMGLHDAARVAALSRFLSAGRDRRIKVAVHDTGPLERGMPRLLTLMRDHAHVIAVRRTPEHLHHLAESYLLADGRHGAIRFHESQARGKRIAGSEPEIRPWWQRFDALWEESSPCSPWAVTGL